METSDCLLGTGARSSSASTDLMRPFRQQPQASAIRPHGHPLEERPIPCGRPLSSSNPDLAPSRRARQGREYSCRIGPLADNSLGSGSDGWLTSRGRCSSTSSSVPGAIPKPENLQYCSSASLSASDVCPTAHWIGVTVDSVRGDAGMYVDSCRGPSTAGGPDDRVPSVSRFAGLSRPRASSISTSILHCCDLRIDSPRPSERSAAADRRSRTA